MAELVRRQDQKSFYLLFHLQVVQGREHLCLTASKSPLPWAQYSVNTPVMDLALSSPMFTQPAYMKR